MTTKIWQMDDIGFEKIKRFVIDTRWEYEFPLTKSTKIQSDLGIYGDDATEFIIAYSDRFHVDVSNFMAADYFSDEGGVKMPFGLSKFFRSSRKDLTLGDLEKGVLAGKLDEEIINS